MGYPCELPGLGQRLEMKFLFRSADLLRSLVGKGRDQRFEDRMLKGDTQTRGGHWQAF